MRGEGDGKESYELGREKSASDSDSGAESGDEEEGDGRSTQSLAISYDDDDDEVARSPRHDAGVLRALSGHTSYGHACCSVGVGAPRGASLRGVLMLWLLDRPSSSTHNESITLSSTLRQLQKLDQEKLDGKLSPYERASLPLPPPSPDTFSNDGRTGLIFALELDDQLKPLRSTHDELHNWMRHLAGKKVLQCSLGRVDSRESRLRRLHQLFILLLLLLLLLQL